MVKSSHSHYVSHCIALHYDNDDDDGLDNDDCVALGIDDDDGDNNNLPSPYILVCFSIFHDTFPLVTDPIQ